MPGETPKGEPIRIRPGMRFVPDAKDRLTAKQLPLDREAAETADHHDVAGQPLQAEKDGTDPAG